MSVQATFRPTSSSNMDLVRLALDPVTQEFLSGYLIMGYG